MCSSRTGYSQNAFFVRFFNWCLNSCRKTFLKQAFLQSSLLLGIQVQSLRYISINANYWSSGPLATKRQWGDGVVSVSFMNYQIDFILYFIQMMKHMPDSVNIMRILNKHARETATAPARALDTDPGKQKSVQTISQNTLLDYMYKSEYK